jgi:hypothetical protein
MAETQTVEAILNRHLSDGVLVSSWSVLVADLAAHAKALHDERDRLRTRVAELERALRQIAYYDDGSWAAGKYAASARSAGRGTMMSIARTALGEAEGQTE